MSCALLGVHEDLDVRSKLTIRVQLSSVGICVKLLDIKTIFAELCTLVDCGGSYVV